MVTLPIPEPWLRTVAAGYERYGRLLPALAAALFAILVGRALADLVWSLVPLPESARWQPPPAAAEATARPPAGIDLGTIVSAGLFGRYQAPADTPLTEAPDTPLNLVLLGLLAADNDEESRAMIAAQGGDEKAYAIGDDVSRGVTLQAIFPDRVILSRNGRLETLRLERDKPGSAASATAATPASPDDEEVATASSPLQQLAQIRDEVLKDPAKASEYVRVQPANVGGQLKGYRVYPGRDRTVFSAAGLRPGDLVTSVNGVQLDDPAKALQMLGDLTQSSSVTLVIERGGQAQTISVSLN